MECYAFGLTNAPATFQRLMNSLLADFTWFSSVDYLDDVIIYSKDTNSYYTHLEKIILKFREYNLY